MIPGFSRLFPMLVALAGLAACAPVFGAETLKGPKAQNSPQAEVFLAYEKALLFDGMDAAGKYMTPKRRQAMNEMLKQLGPESFKEFQAKMRESNPQGDARRRQIETLVVSGDRATLTARSSPHFVDEVFLVRMKDGWKIGERGE